MRVCTIFGRSLKALMTGATFMKLGRAPTM
jgi:hypothetical protein